MESQREPRVQLRPEVRAVKAYRQGVAAPSDGFKLSSNENPFGPLPSVLEKVSAANDFNRYADASMLELRTRISERFGVTVDEVHVASGSVAILYQLIHAAAGAGEEYVFAWPSFEAYPSLGLSSGSVPVAVPLNQDQTHNLEAMAAAVTERTRVIILCTPNNPTSTIITRADFDAFMAAIPKDVLVILDEAYREFVDDPTAVRGEEVLRDHPQLVVLRTFSKAYGLAGLRIGYAVGDAAILDAARTVSIPLSVTGLAHDAAVASLDVEDELHERIRILAERRNQLAFELRRLGYSVPEAQGNFVWLTLGERATEFAEFLATHGVIVRPFAGLGVRVSAGEAESIPRVIELASRFITETGAHDVEPANAAASLTVSEETGR